MSTAVERSRTRAPRVLHLIETGGPGGAESVFATLVAKMHERDEYSAGVVPYDGWLAQTLRASGHEPLIVAGKGAFDASYLRRVATLARQHRIDVICAHLFGAAVYGALLAKWLRIPLVSVLHGVSDFGSNQRFATLKTWLVRSSAAVVFVSDSLRATLSPKLRLAEAATTVIHNGVDVDRLTPRRNDELRRRLALAEDSIIIGSVGNIRPAKGYDVLLDAARSLCADDPRVHFVIAGQPQEPLQSALESQRAAYGLEKRVHFAGMQQDVGGFLNGCDIYLLSSTSEGFSIACVEAMACGLPIVATRCGGPEEILAHEVTGLLVANGQPAEIVSGLARLIGSPELRMTLAKNARERAIGTFSVERMVESYRALFARVAGR
jgi:glycosyltransferase involved in cell wall biosynthesis